MDIEYLTDKDGHPRAVVLPIDLWRRLLPIDEIREEVLAEAIEDHCLNRAMDEGQKSPLLRREEALRYLDED